MVVKWIRKAAVLLLAVLVWSVPGHAAVNFLVNDTFTQAAGEKPANWIVKEIGGAVAVASTAGTSPETNALCLLDSDAKESSGVAAMRRFPAQKRTTAFEIRFKYDKQMGDFSFVIGGGSADAVQITSGTDGVFSCSDGSSVKQYSQSTAKLNNWNTVRVVINPNKGTADVRVNQELIKGLSTREDCSADGLDFVLLKTEKGMPNVYVDYVKIETGDGLNAEVQPIQAPLVDDPAPRPVPGRINVNYNGEYLYFDDPPVMINDRVMVPLRKIFELFSMQVEWDQNTDTALISDAQCQIEVTADSDTAKVNGEIKPLDAPAAVINDRMFVPVRFIAESAGAQVEWDERSQTVLIKR